MNYIALNIAFSEDEQAEILTAELADYPFESFETEDGTLKAYIPRSGWPTAKPGSMPCSPATACRDAISPSRPRTGTPYGRAISRPSMSKAAC